jgi:ABC-2 type transport system ATP-binding protein
VAGCDVLRETVKVRPCINMVSGGESSGYGLLTVRENLWMFTQFYGIPSALAYQRIDALLATFGLADRARTKSSDLSTGLRQKMNIIRGLMTDPEVLFLDEPTLGLDVGASRDVRKFVRGWVDENPARTLLLTTHYMVEADELCDRVAIINKGRVLACDTPAVLKHQLQKEAIFNLDVSPLNGLGTAPFEALPGVHKVLHTRADGHSQMQFYLAEEAALAGVVDTLTRNSIRILNLQKREPTLEDVFVTLVGRKMSDEEQNGNGNTD